MTCHATANLVNGTSGIVETAARDCIRLSRAARHGPVLENGRIRVRHLPKAAQWTMKQESL